MCWRERHVERREDFYQKAATTERPERPSDDIAGELNSRIMRIRSNYVARGEHASFLSPFLSFVRVACGGPQLRGRGPFSIISRAT